MHKRILFIAVLFTNIISYGQITITGYVFNSNRQPLQNVTIYTNNKLAWAITNNKGYYKISLPNTTTLTFSHLGYKTVTASVNNNTPQLNITLLEDNLSLNEVIVTGTIKNKRSTSTVIKKKAIEHLQASSLADIMQLVPGQLIQNQNFSEVKQVLLRQKDTRDGTEDAAAFGTNIRINGISVSNNANLQNASSALRGNVNYFNSTAARGNDLRNFTTDNIEKIEIIKGIPSASYGDITSGVILIETQKGKTPLTIKQRITPKTYQTFIGKGFLLGEKHTLNLDIDYTKALVNERDNNLNYNKYSLNTVHSKSWSENFKTISNLRLYSIIDGNTNTNDNFQRKSTQKGFQLSINNNWQTKNKWFQKITFDIATSYDSQKSLDKQIVNKPLSILSPYHTTHEGIGVFLPQTYKSEVQVQGKPFSFYSKITNQNTLTTGKVKHNLITGFEYNLEKNFGSGITFDSTRPPEGLSSQSLRERPYNSVPSLKQFSFFTEDKLNFSLGYLKNELSIGFRVDNFQPKSIYKSPYGLQFTPRLSFSSTINNKLTLKGGWGEAAKAPSLLFLYPDNAFYDLVSLNYFTGNPKENLAIVTTHTYDTSNSSLNVAKSNKFEVGLNYSFKQHNFDLIYYKDQTNNAFGYQQEAVFMPYNIYKVTNTTTNQLPNYQLKETKNFIGIYNKPSNNFTIKNKGIELLSDLKIDNNLRTQISGAYIQTESIYNNDNYKINTNPTSGNQLIASYKNGGTNTNTQINTTIRNILHLPDLKFVISLNAQTIWYENQSQKNYENLPYQYSTSNGSFVNFDTNNTNLVNLFYRNDNNSTTNNKPIWLFTLNLTKEIGSKGKLSFFANNIFNNRPIINNRVRNIPFFYGFEASIKL